MFEFEKHHLRVDRDFDIDHNDIVVYLETWFDVDEKFCINTRDTENWVNFYAYYNPFIQTLQLIYIIENSDCEFLPDVREYIPSNQEQNLIIQMIEEACKNTVGCSCTALILEEVWTNTPTIPPALKSK